VTADVEPASSRSRRILGLIRKEWLQIVRDPSSILVAVVIPTMLLFLFGYGVSFDPRSFKIGLVVEQPSAETGSFTAALMNSRYFEIKTGRDRRAFEGALATGELHGIVVLSVDSAKQAYRGEPAPIQVLVDGSDPNTANLVRNYIEAMSVNWLEQESLSLGQHLMPPGVTVEQRLWFNPELSSRNYLVPGSVAIIMTLIGALLTALVAAREWERGTMEALLATPLGIVEFLIGKLVPYFLLGMGSMVLSVAIAVLLFGVPFRGSFLTLAVVSAGFMWAALGQGLLISTLTRNQLVAAQASAFTAFLPSFYFSDFVFETGSMPWPLQLMSYVVPARYFASSLETLFLAGDVAGVILPDLLALLVIAGCLTGLTALITRNRLE
jgi:ABC-2 type transport system permease protein